MPLLSWMEFNFLNDWAWTMLMHSIIFHPLDTRLQWQDIRTFDHIEEIIFIEWFTFNNNKHQQEVEMKRQELTDSENKGKLSNISLFYFGIIFE